MSGESIRLKRLIREAETKIVELRQEIEKIKLDSGKIKTDIEDLKKAKGKDEISIPTEPV
jgi:hypothetical protein